jgi:hypothetical protein
MILVNVGHPVVPLDGTGKKGHHRIAPTTKTPLKIFILNGAKI